MSTTKRTTTVPVAPKPPVSFAPAIIISDSASLVGTKLITIGNETVIHPRAKLISSFAPVTVGKACILSERSAVGLQSQSTDQPEGVIIEDYVVIEVGALVEAKCVGEGTSIEVNVRVGKGAVIGKYCKIGPLCTIEENENLPDHTVIYGAGMRRVDNSGVDDLKLKMVRRQVEMLKKLIPSNPVKFQ